MSVPHYGPSLHCHLKGSEDDLWPSDLYYRNVLRLRVSVAMPEQRSPTRIMVNGKDKEEEEEDDDVRLQKVNIYMQTPAVTATDRKDRDIESGMS